MRETCDGILRIVAHNIIMKRRKIMRIGRNYFEHKVEIQFVTPNFKTNRVTLKTHRNG